MKQFRSMAHSVPAVLLVSVLCISGCATSNRINLPPGEDPTEYRKAITERGAGIPAPEAPPPHEDDHPLTLGGKLKMFCSRAHLGEGLFDFLASMDFGLDDAIGKATGESPTARKYRKEDERLTINYD
jgi:hypothetical protein